MARSLWQFVKGLFRRGKTEVGPQESVTLRDVFADKTAASTADLAAQLARGDINLAQWSADMALTVRNVTIGQYLLGRGGSDAMTDADRATLSDLVGQQLGYLRDFSRDIAGGGWSEGEIAQRSALYAESAIEAHSRGAAAAMGVELPDEAVPPVHARCRCRIEYDGDGSWSFVTSEDERTCSICEGLASQYQGVAA